MMRQLCYVTACLLLAAPAFAAETAPPAGIAVSGKDAPAATPATAPAPSQPLDMSGGGGPLEVTAQQSLEWHENEQMYRAVGQAQARRGDVTINAGELRAFQRANKDGKKEVYKFNAIGNVTITSKQQQIFGDQAVYDTDKQYAVLTGKNLRFVNADETVTAQDALEYWPQKKQAIARGKAVAVRADRRVTADSMTAQFRDGAKGGLELDQLTADGHVVITTKTDVARGDKAVYDLAHNSARLTGKVMITRGASQLAGSAAEVDFKTGISRMTAGGQDGKVHALFVPDANKGDQALALPSQPR